MEALPADPVAKFFISVSYLKPHASFYIWDVLSGFAGEGVSFLILYAKAHDNSSGRVLCLAYTISRINICPMRFTIREADYGRGGRERPSSSVTTTICPINLVTVIIFNLSSGDSD